MPYIAPAQLAPSTPFAALMQSTLNTMGPKNAATFMNSLAEGMSKVTNQYLQKMESGGSFKPPMIPVLSSGGDAGGAPPPPATGRSGPERGGGLKRSNVSRQKDHPAILSSKRNKIFQMERSQLEKLLSQAQFKDQQKQQQPSKKKTAGETAPKGRQQIGPLPGSETLTSEQAGNKLKAMDKGAKGKLKESQGSLQQNVLNSILASKAQSIKFGNGLKPSKKVCFVFSNLFFFHTIFSFRRYRLGST